MFFINPFIYAAGADFESIATVTVGSGGATEINFADIPQTYQHLQLRKIDLWNATSGSTFVQFNGATSTYAYHNLGGNGASAAASAASGTSGINLDAWYVGHSSTHPNVAIVDILDYASTTKATTVRSFSGIDKNGSGEVNIGSGLWTSTSAVTAMKLYSNTSATFNQYTTFALYGIKAP